jgi:uncharacterized membrane protein
MFFAYAAVFVFGRVFGVFHGFQDFEIFIETDPSIFILLGRIYVLICSILLIFVVYEIGKTLFNRKTGVIAAMLTGLAPLLITDSHFMTLDIPSTFYSFASLLFACYIFRGDMRLRNFIFAGVSLGLAISTKYNSGLMIIPLVCVLIFSYGAKDRKSMLKSFAAYLVFAFLAFAATSPFVLLDYGESSKQIMFESVRVKTGQPGFDINPPGPLNHPFVYQLLAAFPFSLGLPLYILSIFGLAYAVRMHKKEHIILLSFFIPYFLMTGSWVVVLIRYYIPLLVIFILFASEFAEKKMLKNKIGIASLMVIVIYTSLFTSSMILPMSNDTRIQASQFIKNNITEGSMIARGGYAPPYGVDEFKYRVVKIEREFNDTTRQFADLGNVEFRSICFTRDENIDTLNESIKEAEFVTISSMAYINVFKEKDRCPLIYEFLSNLVSDKPKGYERMAQFSQQYLNQDFYSVLDPMYGGGYYLNPTIIILRKA